MIKWKVKDEIVLFPKDWGKQEVLKWINCKAIRICPVCKKLDVAYNHFNSCDPSTQAALRANRDMAGI